MSEPTSLTKEEVSLDDLKRAIEALPAAVTGDDFVGHDMAFLDHADRMEAERNAWRTAFEWYRDNDSGMGWRYTVEYNEGMALIREKLQS